MKKVGGTTSEKGATPEIQEICNKVKPQVEKADGRNFAVFKALKYTTQVVAGTNYFVKVDVGGNECLHLRIFRDLQGALILSNVQKGKTRDAPLAYF